MESEHVEFMCRYGRREKHGENVIFVVVVGHAGWRRHFYLSYPSDARPLSQRAPHQTFQLLLFRHFQRPGSARDALPDGSQLPRPPHRHPGRGWAWPGQTHLGDGCGAGEGFRRMGAAQCQRLAYPPSLASLFTTVWEILPSVTDSIWSAPVTMSCQTVWILFCHATLCLRQRSKVICFKTSKINSQEAYYFSYPG